MPPKKKEEFKRKSTFIQDNASNVFHNQIEFVPIYSDEKPAKLFWEYEQFSAEDRSAFDAYFINFQKEIAVKMTDSLNANMEFLALTIGKLLLNKIKHIINIIKWQQANCIHYLRSHPKIQNKKSILQT